MSGFGQTTTFVKTIPHAAWNAAVKRFARSRPLTVKVLPPRGLTHAWKVSTRWDPETERWGITVRPGHVSGEPEVLLGGEKIRLAVPFTIPAERWRAIGGDAAPVLGAGESVPPYFLAMGVAPVSSEMKIEGETLQITLTGDRLSRKERRLLRAAELILVQPRPSVRIAWEEVDSRVAPKIDVVAAAGGPSLVVRPSWTDPVEASASRDEIATGLVDAGIDELRIATLYLVSQPGAPDGAEIDETWRPYVRHYVFRNLRHAVDRDVVPILESPVIFSTFGLAGGAGEAIVQGLAQGLNDAEGQLQAWLNRSRIRGRFWTI
jgi:hypothetical protein